MNTGAVHATGIRNLTGFASGEDVSAGGLLAAASTGSITRVAVASRPG